MLFLNVLSGAHRWRLRRSPFALTASAGRLCEYGVSRSCVQAASLVLSLVLGPAALCAQTPPALNLVVLGDSLTAGYGLAPQQAFPAVLEQALDAQGLNVRVINAGVSGDTASDGLARLDWSVGQNADAVLLELGANDMLRGLNPASTRQALDAILARLKERGIKVMIVGMYASPTLGREYVSAFQNIYPELAQKYDAPLYPFFLNGVAGLPRLEQQDGMHPNARGVRVIVAAMLPSVEKFLASVEPRGGPT